MQKMDRVRALGGQVVGDRTPGLCRGRAKFMWGTTLITSSTNNSTSCWLAFFEEPRALCEILLGRSDVVNNCLDAVSYKE